MWVFLNDRFVPEKEACISVFDQGFLYGDGIFETLRVQDRRVRFLDHHLARLRESCHLINLPLPNPEPHWKEHLQELCERNSLVEAAIRITVTRGTSATGFGSPSAPAPTMVMFARPLPDLTSEQKEHGVSIVTTDIRRQSPLALPPNMKSLNYLNNILAKQEATMKQAFDGLMLNTDNHVSECTTSNVFFVKHTQLCTPSTECGILPGITRKIVLKLSQEEGFHIQEGRFERQEMSHATECFLTNTGFGVLPVHSIDSHRMGPYGRDSITYRLRQAYMFYLNTAG